MATYRERDLDDYLIELDDTVEFRTPSGAVIRGRVTGRGAAGNYLEIRGEDGVDYSAYSSDSDLRKIFKEDER